MNLAKTLDIRSYWGEATKITITHEQFVNTEDRDKHNEGWNGCLNRLQRTLATATLVHHWSTENRLTENWSTSAKSPATATWASSPI